MSFIENIIKQAKKEKQTVVLPEATDIRILKAASKSIKEGTANVILVGNETEITKIANNEGINLYDAKIVNPENSAKLGNYINDYAEIYKFSIKSRKEAEEAVKTPLIFGMMMVNAGDADAYVAGATHSTKDVLQPTMKIFRTMGTRILSTVTVIEFKNKDFGNKDGLFFISDCALNAEPGYLALAEIGKATANSYRGFINEEPKVAFLSFSTHGSASSKSTDKVAKAAQRLKKLEPRINFGWRITVRCSNYARGC